MPAPELEAYRRDGYLVRRALFSPVDAATAARLRQGPLADQFAFLRDPRR